MIRLCLLTLAAASLLASCGSKPIGEDPAVAIADLEALPAPDARDYRVDAQGDVARPLDVLEVAVFDVPELTRIVRVGSGGFFEFPLIGAVQANGRPLAEIAYEIESRLQPDYVRDPSVTVEYSERPGQLFTIGGEIESPGQYPILQPLNLLEAMAIGGGQSQFARLDEVLVFREVGGQRYIGVYNVDAMRRGNYPPPRIYPHDTIMVGESANRRLIADILLYTQLFSTPVILFERLSR